MPIGPEPLNHYRVARGRGVDLAQAAHRRVIADARTSTRAPSSCRPVRAGSRGWVPGSRYSPNPPRSIVPRRWVDVRVAVVDRVRAAQAHQAVVAVPARRGMKQHAVALAKRRAERIHHDIRAELGHDPDILMAQDDGVDRVRVIPVMSVRPADSRHAHLQQNVIRAQRPALRTPATPEAARSPTNTAPTHVSAITPP